MIDEDDRLVTYQQKEHEKRGNSHGPREPNAGNQTFCHDRKDDTSERRSSGDDSKSRRPFVPEPSNDGSHGRIKDHAGT